MGSERNYKGSKGTLKLLEELKEVAMDIVSEYKQGFTDAKGNYIPPSPEKVAYLLGNLVTLARYERELEKEEKPTDNKLAMVPFDLN